MGYGYGYEGMAFMWLPMAVCAAILVAGLALVIVVAFRLSRGGARLETREAGSARQILDERYARGDIDHDEYSKRKDLLA